MSTLQAIANKLDISAATVSRALRNHDGVNPKTREKILSTARELGYGKSPIQMTHGLALIVPGKSLYEVHELAHRFMMAVTEAVTEIGWQMYPVVIPPMGPTPLDDMDTWPKALQSEHVDGCLVVDQISPEARDLLTERFNHNVVMLSRHDIARGISGVRSLDYDAGELAIEKLLNAGHKRIGWIGSLGSEDISRERRAGVEAILHKQGSELCCEVWLEERCALNPEVVSGRMQQALPENRDDWPTAWVSSTDWLGAKVMLWYRSQGMEVPGDVSLIAFDDTHAAEALVGCRIHSVTMPYEKMARGAVQLLASRLMEPDMDPVVWSYPFSLREGVTVAPPRK